MKGTPSKYNKFNKETLAFLEQSYINNKYPTKQALREMSVLLDQKMEKLQNWFKHNRKKAVKKGIMKFEKKNSFSKQQHSFLHEKYRINSNPSIEELILIAKVLDSRIKSVKNWFAYQRKLQLRKKKVLGATSEQGTEKTTYETDNSLNCKMEEETKPVQTFFSSQMTQKESEQKMKERKTEKMHVKVENNQCPSELIDLQCQDNQHKETMQSEEDMLKKSRNLGRVKTNETSIFNERIETEQNLYSVPLSLQKSRTIFCSNVGHHVEKQTCKNSFLAASQQKEAKQHEELANNEENAEEITKNNTNFGLFSAKEEQSSKYGRIQCLNQGQCFQFQCVKSPNICIPVFLEQNEVFQSAKALKNGENAKEIAKNDHFGLFSNTQPNVNLVQYQQIQQNLQPNSGIFLHQQPQNNSLNAILLNNYLSLYAQLMKNQVYLQQLNELLNNGLQN